MSPWTLVYCYSFISVYIQNDTINVVPLDSGILLYIYICLYSGWYYKLCPPGLWSTVIHISVYIQDDTINFVLLDSGKLLYIYLFIYRMILKTLSPWTLVYCYTNICFYLGWYYKRCPPGLWYTVIHISAYIQDDAINFVPLDSGLLLLSVYIQDDTIKVVPLDSGLLLYIYLFILRMIL